MSTPSSLNIPSGDATVVVRAFDSVDPTKSRIPAAFFLSPVLEGHEEIFFPAYAFLIENPRTGRRVMFDLGVREPSSYPPQVRQMFEHPGVEMVVHDVVDQLVKGGVDLESIDTVIWSHTHVDHVGDVSRFPPSTQLVVGRGTNVSTYPGQPDSGLREQDFRGRSVRELTYGNLKIGGFDALDFFGDGSLYLLDAPGHISGHTCGLARVTPTSFVFLGADISHHPGEFRPSAFLHKTIACPGDIISAANKAISKEHFAPQASEPFDLTKREGPMLDIAEHGVHENPAAAREAVQKMLPFDAHPDVFVVIAHDQTLVGHLPLFPEAINDSKKTGLKEKVAWSSFEPKNAAWRYSK
ncbi:hypothetical protein EV714DRAFT_242621, partial [Schizophyllum commune]